MSPKTKLGRNPFAPKGTNASAKATKSAAKASTPKHAKKASASAHAAPHTTASKPKSKSRPKAEPRAYRRKKGQGFSHFIEELTHHWLPRLKACAYVRALKLAARL